MAESATVCVDFSKTQRIRRGIHRAVTVGMVAAKRFEDLDLYQLAVTLRREIVQCTSSGLVSGDRRFVDQIRNAARGVTRNVAEGFGRGAPSEFAKFLRYAKGSLDETKAHIQDAAESGYFTDEECQRLVSLVRRTFGALNRLMAYLESPRAKRAYARTRGRSVSESDQDLDR